MTTEHSGHQRVSLRAWESELSKRQAFVSHGRNGTVRGAPTGGMGWPLSSRILRWS